jgi:hypothetical protein
MIKVPLVALEKSQMTLVANDNEFWMKNKSTKYTFIF